MKIWKQHKQFYSQTYNVETPKIKSKSEKTTSTMRHGAIFLQNNHISKFVVSLFEQSVFFRTKSTLFSVFFVIVVSGVLKVTI